MNSPPQHARERGIIIADTKFEFAQGPGGELILIDEVLTPDSSRFWPADTYREGISPPSFDKQFVRDYLETLDWNKQAPAPEAAARHHFEDARQVPRSTHAVDALAAQFARCACSSRTPSVSAAGPGCRMMDDLIS